MRGRTWFLLVLIVAVVVLALAVFTTPTGVGGSSSSTYTGPVRTTSMVLVSQKAWNRKGAIQRIGHGVTMTKTRIKGRALSGPCYRVDAEVHGDSALIDKVVQGFGHFKLCMQAGNHNRVLDRYTNASASHRETWLWWNGSVTEVKGAGVSSTWCNGGVGPCQPVEYRYWRFTFQWLQGVSIFGQDLAHHKTLYIGCTLRAGPGGYQCGMGEA